MSDRESCGQTIQGIWGIRDDGRERGVSRANKWADHLKPFGKLGMEEEVVV